MAAANMYLILRLLSFGILLSAALLVIGYSGLSIWLGSLYGTTYHPDENTTGTRRIVLETSVVMPTSKPAKPEKTTKRWVLSVPRRFVIHQVGGPWADYHSIDIAMMLHRETAEIRSNPHVHTTDPWSNFVLRLTSQQSSPADADNACLDYQDLIDRGRRSPTLSGSLEQIRHCHLPNCSYQFSHSGWKTSLMVSRNIYTDKIANCRMARSLLTEWTVQLDHLHK